jgi:leader peptidase (prepilin peptidase) / N-methyltransferase
MQIVIDIILIVCLFYGAYIDYMSNIIPDKLTFFMMILGLLLSPLNKYMGVTIIGNIVNSIIGLILGGGIIYLLSVVGEWIFKKEVMGGGDIKFFAGIGSFLGIKSIFHILFYASIIASIVSIILIILTMRNRKDMIAFGPFISIGTLLYMYFRKI